MKKTVISVLAILMMLLSGCSLQNSKVNFKQEEVNIHIDGIEGSYKLVFVNDMHIQVNNDEISVDSKDYIEARIGTFSADGTSTLEKWKEVPDMINSINPDFVAFGGDMVDFCSDANIKALSDGLENIKAPYIYVRSDHDTEPYWLANQDKEECTDRQNLVAENSDVLVYDLGELIILGVNNSNKEMSEETYTQIKRVMEIGKPVIIVTHVPVEPSEGDELKTFSETNRDGQHIYLGYTGDRMPTYTERYYLSEIYDDNSPVVAVLAAHMHKSWEGKVSGNAIEHIFTPTFEGSIGIVNIN